ncbi:hypothetical protein GCM10010411_89680 [Actinomadura fulvescens]|uniref:ABC transporter permease n=2 Tax=Actinomadura fulvescens TaxID=46160 RepID=A0ABN3QW10_9ACTN
MDRPVGSAYGAGRWVPLMGRDSEARWERFFKVIWLVVVPLVAVIYIFTAAQEAGAVRVAVVLGKDRADMTA